MILNNKKFGAVILAAGKGTRMHSALPKVLHTLLGNPMLQYVIDALHPLCDKDLWTVVGHKADMVQACIGTAKTTYVLQTEQLGTGHALQCAWSAAKAAGIEYLLVANGDVPLITTDEVKNFVTEAINHNADISFMSMTLPDPAAFGRVVRDSAGNVKAVVEAKDYDCNKFGAEPKEINAGIYLLKIATVEVLLSELQCNNKSSEYYITDLIGLGVKHTFKVTAQDQGNNPALLGANSPQELVLAEELLREKMVDALLAKGVLIRNAAQVRISPTAIVEAGADICGPCEIYGNSHIASGAVIESHCWIKNSKLAGGSILRSFCHIEGAELCAGANIGPFARLRPGALLKEDAHVGNFVEIKKSVLEQGVKAGHLSYIGDAHIGAETNIGAGTITCNYDGKNKHMTIIGKKAFIGSNSALVAPVEIGDEALVGAGSVITRQVGAHELAIGRGKQKNMPRRK